MKISVDEPATSLQQIITENIEHEEVPILETVLELFDIQHDYYQVHHYYANRLSELTAFDRIRKNGN